MLAAPTRAAEPCDESSFAGCLRITAPATVAVPLANGTSSLVVVGAHHFGDDTTDPIYGAVANVAWASVTLVEASPPIFAQLEAKLAAHNPTPHVPRHLIHAVHQGVCPGTEESVLPFYSFDGGKDLPIWATQAGSFSRTHMDRIVTHMSRVARLEVDELESRVHAENVRCSSLLNLLQRKGVSNLGVLLIDTEGFDCEIVASQDWGSAEWCELRPMVIILEWKHCTSDAHSRAIQSLENARCAVRHGSGVEPFRVFAETDENVFLTRVPRRYWRPDRDPARSVMAQQARDGHVRRAMQRIEQAPSHHSRGKRARASRSTVTAAPRFELFDQFPSECRALALDASPISKRGDASWKWCQQQVPGQFEGMRVYDAAIERLLLPNPSSSPIVLEIGALMGQSSCYMSHRLQAAARTNGVHAKFTVLDYWGAPQDYAWLKQYGFLAEWSALTSLSQSIRGGTASIRNVWEQLMCKSGASSGIARHIRGSSRNSEIASMFQDGSISFLYLDTTHAYNDTKEELALWWPKVKRGGWLCGDDYNDALFPMPAAVHDWRRAAGVTEPIEVWSAVRSTPGTVTNDQFCIGKGVSASQAAPKTNANGRAWKRPRR